MINLPRYKILIFVVIGIFLSACTLTDSRLSGKWRSNLELTTDFNEKHAILTERQKKLFSQLFGQMQLTYLSTDKCEVFFPKHKINNGRKIIESDESKEIVEYKILFK